MLKRIDQAFLELYAVASVFIWFTDLAPLAWALGVVFTANAIQYVRDYHRNPA